MDKTYHEALKVSRELMSELGAMYWNCRIEIELIYAPRKRGYQVTIERRRDGRTKTKFVPEVL